MISNELESPFTGGPVEEITEARPYEMRGQQFTVNVQLYRCVDTGELFTTGEQGEDFLTELHRQYRERNRLPSAATLKARREELHLSAREAARFLGFGINQFSQYEAGELPSESNMLLLQLFCDPHALRSLVEARLTNLPERTLRKLQQGPAVRRGAAFTAALAPHVWAGPTQVSAALAPSEQPVTGIYATGRQPREADYLVKAF